MSDADNQQQRKRAVRACRNCRRKKTRCSGERPICAICQRLGQHCHYPAIDVVDYGTRPGNEQIDALQTKMSIIENQLTELTNTINSRVRPPGHMSTSTPGWTQGQAMTWADAASIKESNQAQPSVFSVLPGTNVLLSAADAYFRHCHNQPYSLFHEETFRRDLVLGIVPAHLAFAFLATSIRFLSDPAYTADKVTWISGYARESWKAIVLSGEGLEKTAGISVVQALILLAVIDYTGGKCRAGWIKAGLAIRISSYLQLMLEPDQSLSIIEQELRRRTFWSVYVLDTLISCGRQRPPAIPKDNLKLHMPCGENSFQVGLLQEMPPLEVFARGPADTSTLDAESPWTLLVLVASVFRSCLQYIFQERVHHDEAPWHPGCRFAELEWALLQLESTYGLGDSPIEKTRLLYMVDNDVSQHRVGPSVYAHALFHASHCLLYHPFLLRRRLAKQEIKTPKSFLLRAFHSCETHSTALATLMSEARNMGLTASASMYAYFCYLAGSIHTLSRHVKHPVITDEAASDEILASCLQHIKELCQYWDLANSIVRDASHTIELY
ncbi:hypothetical protein OIDMADRAFT_45088 [Oidiodendron maius Zn]|uniref:Zn(2)-C6 fungal-type domain-containing protein n=1 Tax=Oidiodendron maius (strain Zn) TaxID=913774 RepID=A0A0C3GI12_OIDMZ|nr:hypothetical protein OIDMADRAFT_45088 [Oidiodendron maius Zn]